MKRTGTGTSIKDTPLLSFGMPVQQEKQAVVIEAAPVATPSEQLEARIAAAQMIAAQMIAAQMIAAPILAAEAELVAQARKSRRPVINHMTGALIMPQNVRARYRHWKGRQSLFQTLVELGASLESWKHYGLEEAAILGNRHLRACQRHMIFYSGFVVCPACGWWCRFEGDAFDLFAGLEEEITLSTESADEQRTAEEYQ